VGIMDSPWVIIKSKKNSFNIQAALKAAIMERIIAAFSFFFVFAAFSIGGNFL
jgi:hypothetical protein